MEAMRCRFGSSTGVLFERASVLVEAATDKTGRMRFHPFR
jgi:hypothetical protein